MKINSISTTNCNPNTAFKGYVCQTVRKRAEQFCSPEKMKQYRTINQIYLDDRPMTELSVKIHNEYERFTDNCNKNLMALNRCMTNKFDDSVCITIRPVDNTENQQSVLSLINSRTGRIINVSHYFDTAYGDITSILGRFIKRSDSYVAEIQKPSTLYK